MTGLPVASVEDERQSVRRTDWCGNFRRCTILAWRYSGQNRLIRVVFILARNFHRTGSRSRSVRRHTTGGETGEGLNHRSMKRGRVSGRRGRFRPGFQRAVLLLPGRLNTAVQPDTAMRAANKPGGKRENRDPASGAEVSEAAEPWPRA